MTHSWKAFHQARKIAEQLKEAELLNLERKEDLARVRGIIQIVLESSVKHVEVSE